MAANHKTCCTERASILQPSECQTNALPVRPLRVLCSFQSFLSFKATFTLPIHPNQGYKQLFTNMAISMHILPYFSIHPMSPNQYVQHSGPHCINFLPIPTLLRISSFLTLPMDHVCHFHLSSQAIHSFQASCCGRWCPDVPHWPVVGGGVLMCPTGLLWEVVSSCAPLACCGRWCPHVPHWPVVGGGVLMCSTALLLWEVVSSCAPLASCCGR